jgi:hypothetical protein
MRMINNDYMDDMELIGEVMRIFPEEKFIKVSLSKKIKLGETIIIKNGEIEIKNRVERLSIHSINIKEGFEGDMVEIGINNKGDIENIESDNKVYKL